MDRLQDPNFGRHPTRKADSPAAGLAGQASHALIGDNLHPDGCVLLETRVHGQFNHDLVKNGQRGCTLRLIGVRTVFVTGRERSTDVGQFYIPVIPEGYVSIGHFAHAVGDIQAGFATGKYNRERRERRVG